MIEFFLSNYRISYQLLFYIIIYYFILQKLRIYFMTVQSIVLQPFFIYTSLFCNKQIIFLSILLL